MWKWKWKSCPVLRQGESFHFVTQPEKRKLQLVRVIKLIFCSHQADIRMCSHRLLPLDNNESAASGQHTWCCVLFQRCKWSQPASYPGAFFVKRILYLIQCCIYRSVPKFAKPRALANFGTDLYIQHWIKYNILFTKKAPGYEAGSQQLGSSLWHFWLYICGPFHCIWVLPPIPHLLQYR